LPQEDRDYLQEQHPLDLLREITQELLYRKYGDQVQVQVQMDIFDLILI